MLKLAIADQYLNAIQRVHLGRGYPGARDAESIGVIRRLFAKMIVDFHEAQDKAGLQAIADGRVKTLIKTLNPPIHPHFGWPKKAGWILGGIQYRKAQPLAADRPAGATIGRDCRDIDPESYLCPIAIGPPEARRLGDWIALLLYVDHLQTGFICWIGRESELEAGFRSVGICTGNLSDFRTLSKVYHSHLLANPR